MSFTVIVANGGSTARFAVNVKVPNSDRLVALLLQPHEMVFAKPSDAPDALTLLFVDDVKAVTHWARKISIR